MKGSGSSQQSRSHFQYQQLPESELQRKYFTIRGKTFQALLKNNKRKELKL